MPHKLLAACCVLFGLALGTFPAAASSLPSPAATADPGEVLTLGEVLARTLTDNPELAAARAAVAAAAADARQAGRFANPELALDVENFAGSDALRGVGGAETTLGLAQTVELGGRRSQRRAVGDAAQMVALRQQALTRGDLYVRTVAAFMELLAAQERLQRAETRVELAIRTRAGIQDQIDAGKTPAIAGTRSQPLLVEARLDRDRAAGALTVARQTLAALLGNEPAATFAAAGELSVLPELPAAGNGTAAPAAAPQQALAAAAREQAARELDGEKPRTIPDLTLGLGVRRFEANDAYALVAGISLPLPLFDRNRDGIAAAAARLDQARHLERQAAVAGAAALTAARQDLTNRRAEALALAEELLPAARQSFDAVAYGYRAGKFDLLDLLETQRQLGDVEARLLAAQVDCHVAAARLDALLGRFPLAAAGPNP